VTTVPPTVLGADEVCPPDGARRQIELLFKLRKPAGGLARSRSAKPERSPCEVSAELPAMGVQPGVPGVTCWQRPDRSPVKAARMVRLLAVTLALELEHLARLCDRLRALRDTLAGGSRLTTRRAHPSTYQRLIMIPSAPFEEAQAAELDAYGRHDEG
jgi:hypothetical protein